MSNFQINSANIEFSAARSRNRIEKAVAVIGEKAVKRIIGLALFLLGVNRKKISEMLDLPLGTFFSFLTRFHKEGLDVISSKRTASKDTVPKRETANEPHQSFEIIKNLDKILALKETNPLQHKVLILSFMNLDMLSAKEASVILGYSPQHTRNLAHKLEVGDADTLIDNRQGQQLDYQFRESVKAELIQQFAYNVITGGNTGSRQLCQQVNDASGSSISDRSVRLYMNKLGLNKIKDSLFEMVSEYKKNAGN